MKGILNKGVEELVIAQMGHATWNEVRTKAGCTESYFANGLDYPDELTVNLIKAAAEVKGISIAQMMEEYGKFMVPNTLKQSYQSLFERAGTTAREFLMSMDRIHRQATESIPNAKPPRFSLIPWPNGKLLMHYHSDRGLCPVLKGLILGVGVRFQTKLEVHETACTKEGAPHCTMEITFSD